MNNKDSLKELRLQEEVKFVNQEWIEFLAKLILDEHTELVNKNIFGPLGGELKYSITLGSPNAGIAHGAAEPYSPRMQIRLKLIEEIYRDAFAFPIISNRLGAETDTLQNLHKHNLFKDAPYIFETALPQVNIEWVAPVLRSVCTIMEDALSNNQDERIGPNEIRCRLIMFELMLIWTFYHEIGHALQRHYALHADESPVANLNGVIMDWDLETDPVFKGGSGVELECVDANPQSEDLNLSAQARELMADIEGIGIVLSYLETRSRLNYNTHYLLNCSLSCMFQRFYNGYQENLALTPLRHPHPAVRDNIAQKFILETAIKLRIDKKQVASAEMERPSLTYINIRASLFTGLFRSHRIEMRESRDTLPSYMKLLSAEHHDEMKVYIKKLLPHFQRQIARVMEGLHIVPEISVLPLWEKELQDSVDNYN